MRSAVGKAFNPDSSEVEFLGFAFDALILVHRWLGVASCLFFSLWFLSGAVMMFAPFPSLGAADRAAHSAAFDPAALRISPAEAQQIAGGGEVQRLVAVAGRAAYVVAPLVWPKVVISADRGEPLPPLSQAQARSIAEKFGGAAAVSVQGPMSYDQWIVHQKYDGLRPFYRVRLSDRAATDLYVSSRTGEVAQRTRAAERFWNWPGSIVHKFYMTGLRKDFGVWNGAVWWISLAALATVVTGYAVGVLRTFRSMNLNGLATPFTGWTRWHHLLGLVAGVFVLTWSFSGWLLTDRGRIFPDGSAADEEVVRFTGLSNDAAANRVTLDDLRRLGPSARITFGALGGQAFAAASGGPRPAARVVLAGGAGGPWTRLPDALISRAVVSAWPGAPGPVRAGSASDFYVAAEGMPSSVVWVQAASGRGPRIYVDGATGELAKVIDRGRAVYDWLSFGLHSFRLPGLVERPALWMIAVLPPLIIGFAFSVTGVTLGVRRILLTTPKRKQRRKFGAKVLQSGLDS